MLYYGKQINFLYSNPNNLIKDDYSINFSRECCPDQIVASLSYDNGWTFKNNRDNILSMSRHCHSCSRTFDIDYSNKFELPAIIIVLESPHKDEYTGCGKPLGPASGKTGSNIKRHLLDILNHTFKSNISSFLNNLNLKSTSIPIQFELILLNPVQNQASLGITPIDKKTRDTHFKTFWKNSYCTDFNSRINQYTNTTIILNCCTSHLKKLIDTQLKKCNKTNTLLLTHKHPASWK